MDSRVQRLRWPKVLWKESSLRQMGLSYAKYACRLPFLGIIKMVTEIAKSSLVRLLYTTVVYSLRYFEPGLNLCLLISIMPEYGVSLTVKI